MLSHRYKDLARGATRGSDGSTRGFWSDTRGSLSDTGRFLSGTGGANGPTRGSGRRTGGSDDPTRGSLSETRGPLSDTGGSLSGTAGLDRPTCGFRGSRRGSAAQEIGGRDRRRAVGRSGRDARLHGGRYVKPCRAALSLGPGLRPNVLRMPARRQRSQGKRASCQLVDGVPGAPGRAADPYAEKHYAVRHNAREDSFTAASRTTNRQAAPRAPCRRRRRPRTSRAGRGASASASRPRGRCPAGSRRRG